MRPIVFSHIPKTAGTALRLALWANFDQSEILPNLRDLALNSGEYTPLKTVIQRLKASNKYKLVAGHYPMDIAQHLDNPRTIVVLREPAARLLSLYRHRISHGLTTPEDVLASFQKGVVPSSRNGMAKYLAACAVDSSDEELFQKASNVLRTIDIVGVTDNMRRVAEKLEAWEIHLPDKKVNPARSDFQLPTEYINMIHDQNVIDAKLYEIASNL